jgi:predicted alpha/beta-fold hydrolase
MGKQQQQRRPNHNNGGAKGAGGRKASAAVAIAAKAAKKEVVVSATTSETSSSSMMIASLPQTEGYEASSKPPEDSDADAEDDDSPGRSTADEDDFVDEAAEAVAPAEEDEGDSKRTNRSQQDDDDDDDDAPVPAGGRQRDRATTTAGTVAAVAATTMTAALLVAERCHRHNMAQIPPSVYGQHVPDRLRPPNLRSMRPRFGCSSNIIASGLAYAAPGPSIMPPIQSSRETWHMPHDGAVVHLHWYFPNQKCYDIHVTQQQQQQQQQYQQQYGRSTDASTSESPIHLPVQSTPVVLILHGINNHAQFGYMKRLAKAIVEENHSIAITVDFRGAMTGLSASRTAASGTTTATTTTSASTVRLYNAAFTNDLRCIVQRLYHVHRCDKICLVGHSLGANIMVKYLGEQGNDGNIIKAAVALGNPSVIDSRNASALYSPLIAAGIKHSVWQNRHAWWDLAKHDHHFRYQLRNMFTAWSLAKVDAAVAPLLLRHDPPPNHATRLGYYGNGNGGANDNDGKKNGEEDGYYAAAEDYWRDSSSYRYVSNISVPLLHVYSRDDHLVAPSNRRVAMRHYLANPNVVVVETPCGGHLGWQEEAGGNYAVHLVLEFFKAVLSPSDDPDDSEPPPLTPPLQSKL